MKRLTALLAALTTVVAVAIVEPVAALGSLTQGTLGADVSYPQCGGSLPGSSGTATASFGIVGVNNGRPGASNPCLGAEFGWAAALTAQVPQLYVNTADPGNTVADWPTGNQPGLSNPYGTCTAVKSRGKIVGANSQACAFEYGAEQATSDTRFASEVGASAGTWWLDVETANSWLSRGQIGLNQADLLGMVDIFHSTGSAVGAYSTHYQWNKILGALSSPAAAQLDSLAQWIPTGGSSKTTAQADCSDTSVLPSFTNGTRAYVQYSATYDYDVAC